MVYYIGIDPSTSKTGYAVLNNAGELVDKGVILAAADDPFAFHLLYDNLSNLYDKYPPTSVICEQQFAGPNMATMIKLIRPTGVVLAVTGKYETDFMFKNPSSWRKVYHKDTDFEKKYSKRDSFKVTLERFPGSVTTFNKDNDISDAIGIAYACWQLAMGE